MDEHIANLQLEEKLDGSSETHNTIQMEVEVQDTVEANFAGAMKNNQESEKYLVFSGSDTYVNTAKSTPEGISSE